jgi:hypothetical protein
MIRNMLLPAFIVAGMHSCSVLVLAAPLLGHLAPPVAVASVGR